MITSASNDKIKLVRALQTQRRAREKEQLFVVEGVRLLEEALHAQAAVRLVLHTDSLDARGRAVINQLARLGASVEAVTPAVMAAVSADQTPPGLLGVAPFAPAAAALPTKLSFALVLDRIGDPGNLGTMLRTADAAGVQAVFLAPGTVDAYNPKVVRAAMGAHFHLPIVSADWAELAQRLAGIEVWLAEAREGVPYPKVNWRGPSALLIGSEAEGPSAEALAFTERRVCIPMPGRAESLNAAVAAGILMFEVARQRDSQSATVAPAYRSGH
jgi:RNA methyltransferase, TrmH family